LTGDRCLTLRFHLNMQEYGRDLHFVLILQSL